MPQFSILFYANDAILETQRGCHSPMPPQIRPCSPACKFSKKTKINFMVELTFCSWFSQKNLLGITRGGQSSRKIYLNRSIVTYSKMPFR